LRIGKLDEYEKLMTIFLDRKITAKEFESRYLSLFKNDNYLYSDDDFVPIEMAFSALDAFCAEDEIFDENDIDEGQLRLEISNCLQKLKTRKT